MNEQIKIRLHFSHLSAHLRALEQNDVSTPKRSRWQEIIKLKDDISKTESMRTMFTLEKDQ